MAPATATPSSAAPPARQVENLADLLEHLGNIPPWRIRYHPPPGTATEADLLAVLKERVCELIDGVLVEKPMGFKESMLAHFVTELVMHLLGPAFAG